MQALEPRNFLPGLSPASHTVFGKTEPEQTVQDYGCTKDWCAFSGYRKESQAQPVFIVEDPEADFVFGEAGIGPKLGGIAHNELTTSQCKKGIGQSNGFLSDMLKKLHFMERRQQRQKTGLAEQAREFAMAGALGCCAFFCYFCEFLHFAFLNNPILGCFCLPLHVLMCLGSCAFYNCFGCSTQGVDGEGDVEEPDEFIEELEDMANFPRLYEAPLVI